jgi:hypothetical protein
MIMIGIDPNRSSRPSPHGSPTDRSKGGAWPREPRRQRRQARLRLPREVEEVLAVLTAAGDRAHRFGHPGTAVYALLAAEASSLRSLVLYELPLIDRLDASFIDGLIDVMEYGRRRRSRPGIGAVLADPQHRRRGRAGPSGVGTGVGEMREGVRLVPREMRSARRDGHDWLVGFARPTSPCSTSRDRRRTRACFRAPATV